MKILHCLLIIMLTASLYLPLCAQSGLPNVSVFDLDAQGITSHQVSILSDRLESEIFNTGRFNVLEREKMKEILSEQSFQQTGCTSEECLIQVGKLLGVQQMIGGTVGKFSAQLYTFSARIVDIESGKIIKSALVDIQGDIDAVLKDGCRIVARQLADLESQTHITIGETPQRRTLPQDPPAQTPQRSYPLTEKGEKNYTIHLGFGLTDLEHSDYDLERGFGILFMSKVSKAAYRMQVYLNKNVDHSAQFAPTARNFTGVEMDLQFYPIEWFYAGAGWAWVKLAEDEAVGDLFSLDPVLQEEVEISALTPVIGAYWPFKMLYITAEYQFGKFKGINSSIGLRF